jgi:hypothetical protein
LHNLTQSKYRGIFAAALISVGGYAASTLLAGSQSTYICPIILNGPARLQAMKAANVVIDSILLIGITELCQNGTEIEESRRRPTMVSLGVGLLVSYTAGMSR